MSRNLLVLSWVKTTSIFSVGERGTDEWSDPTPLEDRFCAIFIVSGTEYPDVYSLFDGNDELREGLRDNMLIIGQKAKSWILANSGVKA